MAFIRTVSNLLSGLLSLLFLFSAANKLHPAFPMHAKLIHEAPLWLDALHLQSLPITPDLLLQAIGAAEAVLGLLLLATPLAAAGLVPIMLGAVYTHYGLDGGELTQDAVPAGVTLGLLLVLLSMYPLVVSAKKREAEEAAAAEGKRE